MRKPFEIGTETVAPGERRTVQLPISVMSDHTPVTMAAHVIHGRKPGPVMFISAAIHGDEVIGVEIVRRLLASKPLTRLSGTLIAVPIVNTYGFLANSRYLPDRRDLNRCFPGSVGGSLASRLAQIFTNEILARSDYGIDLHSAAVKRTNLPQIRLSPRNPRLAALGDAFAPPVILTSPMREGSLRETAEKMGVDVLLYEAGEGLRLDEFSARIGVAGILRVMAALDMIPPRGVPKPRGPSVKCGRSSWLRAPTGGLFRSMKAEGDWVDAGTVLGVVSDALGLEEHIILAEEPGIIIGRSKFPIVNEGDAVFHIAEVRQVKRAGTDIEASTHESESAPLFDEDEII
ncbi:succinylglutamate desuccinylase/aspartoacylase family protein [Rhodobacteraceae bacterium ASV31]|nr:succinylglutamate desuccinylase/aspartoacylase family protein [Anianabacter salinae]